MPPPPDDAPYKVRLKYYRGFAYMSPALAAADALIQMGADWLRRHGEITEAEHQRLLTRARAAQNIQR
jgi:hypothetical protein